jgi:hypothetical protein
MSERAPSASDRTQLERAGYRSTREFESVPAISRDGPVAHRGLRCRPESWCDRLSSRWAQWSGQRDLDPRIDPSVVVGRGHSGGQVRVPIEILYPTGPRRRVSTRETRPGPQSPLVPRLRVNHARRPRRCGTGMYRDLLGSGTSHTGRAQRVRSSARISSCRWYDSQMPGFAPESQVYVTHRCREALHCGDRRVGIVLAVPPCKAARHGGWIEVHDPNTAMASSAHPGQEEARRQAELNVRRWPTRCNGSGGATPSRISPDPHRGTASMFGSA